MNAAIAAVRNSVSAEEWQTRVDLAACYRLVARYGWDDLIFTHISARVPGPDNHFLINPYGMTVRGDHGVEPGQDRPRRPEGRSTARTR